jgi:hypothetical protein
VLVKINRGPNFGQELHLPTSQETNLAILLGDIVPVVQAEDGTPLHPNLRAQAQAATAQAIAEPGQVVFSDELRFVVRKNPLSDKWQVYMTKGSFSETFFGNPDQLANYNFGGKNGYRCPVEIVEQYRKAFNAAAASDNARLMAREGSRR